AGLVFLLWGSGRLQVTFSRPDGRVRVVHSGLLGTKSQEFAMADIREMQVAGLAGDCQLYLVLNSGKRIALSSSTDTEGLGGPRRVRARRLKDAERLRAFCQLSPGA